jgi:hypothetical protein
MKPDETFRQFEQRLQEKVTNELKYAGASGATVSAKKRSAYAHPVTKSLT